MRFFKPLILLFILLLLFQCGREEVKLTQEQIKDEIKAWWGAKIFEGIVIEDTIKKKDTYTVNARMVVASDTLESMKYVLKRYWKGYRIWKGPLNEKEKRKMIEEMLQIPLNMAKNNVIKSNMRDVHRALMQYASGNEGRFPANMDVKETAMSYSLRDLLGPYMKNPYVPGAPAVMVSHEDTSQWLPEYKGKVIYFPLDVDFDEVSAELYVVKGSTNRRFLRFVMKSRDLY
jgi:hypothetical protein